MENNLIVVKQLPIIEDQLRQVKTSVDAGDGVVRIGVAPLALIHVMEAARGAVRRLHAVFAHHAVQNCRRLCTKALFLLSAISLWHFRCPVLY